ncbi:exodeoxyribonuclease V subunit alpha [Chitinibacter bivalviorum]|uniref:RecBCD enzyme subunit RecD n=1 Tax=Chitinibacter bivalviorum TaxID=2739434 RepID=A0A7H9BI03_9NEIS|nr:exodeoxyribonuclease V subunit alpha [Chitinibacter bivalviorum]QLG87174.1 exodeoxyribonuclease V subunit alpha [Chitinibacter bivalviorum]
MHSELSMRSSSPFAQAFVDLLRRQVPDAPPDLLGVALQAASATERGDVCVALPKAVDLNAWRATGLVGAAGDFAPLIAEYDRLYLARYHAYESSLAQQIRDMAAQAVSVPADLAAQISALFGEADPQDVDWQRVAAAAALHKKLMVISGGPGTGKTTTVVKLLALLQSGETPLHIMLAAPTGKAAMRMQEAIRQAKTKLPAALAARIPDQASTIHRLLGSRPNTVQFRHHAANPLVLDVLVVDEASMIDLALMSKLLAALPAHARLVLLGDKDQLASVEAGAVMGDLCDGVGLSPTFAAQLSEVCGQTVQPEFSPTIMGDHVITLQKSYRFSGVIGQLAKAINFEQSKKVFELLQAALYSATVKSDTPLCWRDSNPAQAGQGLLAPIWSAYAPYFAAVAAYQAAVSDAEGQADAAAVFAAFEQFRVLSPLKRGLASVEQVNLLLEQALQKRGLRQPEQTWYAGRAVLVPQNMYELELYNGDIGLTLPDASGKLWVHFLQADGATRAVATSRLVGVESAFAMTVHKSQGSEFAHVLLLLPSSEAGAGQLLSRELVYTAITRAKSQVTLWGEAATIRQAVAKKVERQSGLAERLLK